MGRTAGRRHRPRPERKPDGDDPQRPGGAVAAFGRRADRLRNPGGDHQAEQQADGTVDLVARWSVFGDGGRRLVTTNRSAFRTTSVSNDYPSITRAMSALLAELSREIASSVQRLPAGSTS